MFNIISLKVKCPKCQASLMDREKMVDNEPGIKLLISIGGNDGTIWLSSIYESYNYIADIDIKANQIAQFRCPHCQAILNSEDLCEACHAPLVPFHLQGGGVVSICSRAGCTKHTVAFEDLSTALNLFYNKHTYIHDDRLKFEPLEYKLTPDVHVSEADEEKEIIKTGTMLMTYCPHCKRSLIENRMIKFKVENENGEVGFLMLSPYLNVFSHKSTIKLPEQHTLKSIRCFHCEQELFVSDKNCPVCNSKIAKVLVTAMTKMIDFYICSKKGCIWHGLSDADYQSIVLEDSKDW